MLSKAIPSFINDIKQLLKKDPKRLEIVKNLLESWLKSLDTDMTIEGKEEDPMM